MFLDSVRTKSQPSPAKINSLSKQTYVKSCALNFMVKGEKCNEYMEDIHCDLGSLGSIEKPAPRFT